MQDVRVSYLELPEQLPQDLGWIVPLEGELGPQGIVGCLGIHLHEFEEQMSPHLMFHGGVLLLQHDEELRSPEYPDPGWHLLSIGPHVGQDLL